VSKLKCAVREEYDADAGSCLKRSDVAVKIGKCWANNQERGNRSEAVWRYLCPGDFEKSFQ